VDFLDWILVYGLPKTQFWTSKGFTDPGLTTPDLSDKDDLLQINARGAKG